jgi:LacI family transcriptional regulator
MIGGIERAVREAGYYMMLYISDDIAEIIQHISIWNVDGLILFSMMDDDGIRVAAKYHKPIVCIDTYSSEKSDDFINVGLDDEKGTCQAVKYLIENGHRKIGFLTDNRVGVDRERFWGYRRALKESGIEYSDRDFFLFKPTKESVDRNIEKLCRKARNYTALFCCSDIYAVIIMAALKDRGFRIPEDISIIGFDDNLYSRVCTPKLTTVHQDATQKGKVAAEILIGLIRGVKPVSKDMRLETRLEIRDTVKKLN